MILTVAPHRGAWIETASILEGKMPNASPLTEGRGLKRPCEYAMLRHASSPLTEGRGLKHENEAVPLARVMSPLTEGRGLKLIRAIIVVLIVRRPSQRGVD